MRRFRRGAGNDPSDVPSVRRFRTDRGEPGVLPDVADMPALPRRRAHRRDAVPNVRRQRQHDAYAKLPGEDPGGGSGRRADPSSRTRRARRRGCAGGRPVRAGPRSCSPVLRTEGFPSHGGPPRDVCGGGARRERRGSDAERPRDDEGPRWNAERQDVPAQGQGRREARRSWRSARDRERRVAAELAGVHPQTLRMYERKGLLQPKRTSGNTRRYSQRDIDRIRAIQELTQLGGISLAGVKLFIEMREQLDEMERRAARLERELTARTRREQPSVDIVPLRSVMRFTWESDG